MERTKKRNGVTGERAAPGTPHHRCSTTGAGPKGEPWERAKALVTSVSWCQVGDMLLGEAAGNTGEG